MGSLSKMFPVFLDDRPKDQRNLRSIPKQIDSKIQDLILAVHLPALKEGSLLASATAPQVVIPASAAKSEEQVYQRKESSAGERMFQLPVKYFPIGLLPCDLYPWINALMQFLLFVPTLRELFIYIPKSLKPFNEFINQYALDLEERKQVSRADSLQVVRCLIGKFPSLIHSFRPMANLQEIIHILFQSTGLSFDWRVPWLETKEKSAPYECLIGHRTIEKQRQYIVSGRACFDLDAFIEYRPDGEEAGSYFTYLKVGNGWVQCADDRISHLRRSAFLEVPLSRGILFHYQRSLL